MRRQLFSLLVLVLAFTAAARKTLTRTNDNDDDEPGEGWPEVIGVRVTDETKTKHKTEQFELTEGFAVRRGWPFTLKVWTDLPVDSTTMNIFMTTDTFKGDVVPEFKTKITGPANEDNTYFVEVTTEADDPIGKYDNIVFYVDLIKEGERPTHIEDFTYSYPFPIYLLFNPWSENEKMLHMDDENLLNEYVVKDWGPVFTGTIKEYGAMQWYYGQNRQLVLDTVFEMLEGLPRMDYRDPLLVAQHLSHNIGCVNMTDSPKPVVRGNFKGVLEGRWAATFPDGVYPGYWTSTIDIIEKWKSNGKKPVKYGQCWVFAAVQNTYLRALGYPTRQVTAFEAMIDASQTLYADRKTHHVVNYYYDKDGKLVYKEGHVWNFHSWNDIWLNREPANHSGWNVLDGTPTGMGPASVAAVKALDESQPWNVSAVISAVHATVRNFLVECENNTMKHKGPFETNDNIPACEVKKQLTYKGKGVRLVVTKKLGEEKFEEEDITKEYVDPDKDAYIPAPHDPFHPEPPTNGANSIPVKEIPIEIFADRHTVEVGQPIKATISVHIPDGALIGEIGPNEGLEIAVVADLVSYDGTVIKEIKSFREPARALPRSNNQGLLALTIDPSDYATKEMGAGHSIEIRALVIGSNAAGLAKTTILLAAPRVVLSAPASIPRASAPQDRPVHPVHVTVSNPFDFELTNVCVDLLAPTLDINGERKVCVTLASGQTQHIKHEILSPLQTGDHTLSVSITGPFLPPQTHPITISTTHHSDLRQWRL